MTHVNALDGRIGTGSTKLVVNQGQPNRPFDEAAVLEELERLRSAISQARTTREEKLAEFEVFMRNSRMAARKDAMRAAGIPLDDEPEVAVAPAPPVQPPIPEPRPEPPPVAEQPAWKPVTPSPPPARPASVSRLDDLSEATAAFPDPPARRRSLDRIIVAAGAGVLIIALLVVSRIGGDAEHAARTTGAGATAAPSPGAPAQTAPAGPQSTASATDAPLPPPDPNKPLQVELVAVRPVWMRVTVDDEVAVARLVPKDQRLRFGADRSVVIRAGDAGAITLSVDGQGAAPLGRDGQTVTRTLVPRSK